MIYHSILVYMTSAASNLGVLSWAMTSAIRLSRRLCMVLHSLLYLAYFRVYERWTQKHGYISCPRERHIRPSVAGIYYKNYAGRDREGKTLKAN